MKKAINHLEHELAKLRAGKANPQILDGIMVEYFGNMTPINQVAGINVPDPKTITIQPWDKKMLPIIEKAIMQANIGIMPQNDGNVIRLIIPPLTEERRKDLVKKSKQEAENAKISVRNIRRECIENLKKLSKTGVPEEIIKKNEQNAQNLINTYIEKIDKIFANKEKDIMTI